MTDNNPIFPPGIYGITPDCQDTDILINYIKQAYLGGMKILQYRNKIFDINFQKHQAKILQVLCKKLNIKFIINDNFILAKEINADGVHIGKYDATLEDLKEISKHNLIVGVSCYNDINKGLEMSKLPGINYLSFGAIFKSQVKPNAVNMKLEDLLKIKRLSLEVSNKFHVPRKSIVAIGGITTLNAHLVVNYGADNIAVINGLFNSDDIYQSACQFNTSFIKKIL